MRDFLSPRQTLTDSTSLERLKQVARAEIDMQRRDLPAKRVIRRAFLRGGIDFNGNFARLTSSDIEKMSEGPVDEKSVIAILKEVETQRRNLNVCKTLGDLQLVGLAEEKSGVYDELESDVRAIAEEDARRRGETSNPLDQAVPRTHEGTAPSGSR